MIYDIIEYETKNDDNNEKKRLQVLISLQGFRTTYNK